MVVLLLNVQMCFSATVDNPMSTDLDANGFDILDVGDIITSGPWVDARIYNSGSFTDVTVSAALTDIGTDEATLLLAPGTWTFGNDVNIPENVTLRLVRGAIISVNSGDTVTIEGPLQASISKILITSQKL